MHSEAGLTAEQTLDGMRRNGRDNARTPMQWSSADQAGFTKGSPWIGVNPNYVWLNAAAQYDDPKSVFNYYRDLIALRKERRVISVGDFSRIDLGDPAIFAFERCYHDERILVVSNLSDKNHDIDLAKMWSRAVVLISNYPASSESALRPWEARVLDMQNE